MARRILVGGLGNIFLGDDAFGVEVARAMASKPPAGVNVVDFGIRGMHLVHALLDGYALAILVDAVSRGGEPGTLYLLEPQAGQAAPDSEQESPFFDPHDLDPAAVLRMVSSLGERVGRVLLVGCEPAPMDAAVEAGGGLSEPVRRAIGPAVELIEELIGQDAAGGGVARRSAPSQNECGQRSQL